ncbi:MAG: hypothetical protein ACPGQS_12800 [Bradymonadia bacterium]
MRRQPRAYILWLAVVLANQMGCVEQSNPSHDQGRTSERYCDGNDDDEDGKVDEGLLNACFGCNDDTATDCVLTSVTLTAQTTEPVLPAAFQYRLHQTIPLQVMGLDCVRERVDTISPLSNQSLELRQTNAEHTWHSDSDRISDAFSGMILDGITPISLSGTTMNTEVALTLTPPSSVQSSIREALDRCTDNFRTSATSTDPTWRVEDTLFVGGSTRLMTVPEELATAFFVLNGQVSDHAIELRSLSQALPFSPDAVRCTVSKSKRVFQSVGVNGYQLSATSTASSSIQFDERSAPPQLRETPTIAYDGSVVSISTGPLPGWGSPNSVEISRSGEVDGTYVIERVSCTLDENPDTIRIAPDDIFDAWTPPAQTEIVRVGWSTVNTPVMNHPNLEFKNALTIQANRPE